MDAAFLYPDDRSKIFEETGFVFPGNGNGVVKILSIIAIDCENGLASEILAPLNFVVIDAIRQLLSFFFNLGRQIHRNIIFLQHRENIDARFILFAEDLHNFALGAFAGFRPDQNFSDDLVVGSRIVIASFGNKDILADAVVFI